MTRLARVIPIFSDESELSPEWRRFLHIKRAYADRRRGVLDVKVGQDTEVRALAAQGYGLYRLAAHYGTSKGNMYNYCRSWGIATVGMKGWSATAIPPTSERINRTLGPSTLAEIEATIPPVEPPLYLAPHLIPIYKRLAAHDRLAWTALKKAGVEDLPPPPGAAADAQTAGDEEPD